MTAEIYLGVPFEPSVAESLDPLTGLADRGTFLGLLARELARSWRVGDSVSLLYLDIDGFALVNSVCGRGEGDKVLVAIARRLEGALRPRDILSRTGGDEFAVICSDHRQVDQGIAVMDRLRSAVAEPLYLEDRMIQVTVAIGVAFSRASDRDDAGADLLLRATCGMRAEQATPGSPVLGRGGAQHERHEDEPVWLACGSAGGG